MGVMGNRLGFCSVVKFQNRKMFQKIKCLIIQPFKNQLLNSLQMGTIAFVKLSNGRLRYLPGLQIKKFSFKCWPRESLIFIFTFQMCFVSAFIINSKFQVLGVINQSSWVYNIRMISK